MNQFTKLKLLLAPIAVAAISSNVNVQSSLVKFANHCIHIYLILQFRSVMEITAHVRVTVMTTITPNTTIVPPVATLETALKFVRHALAQI